MRAGLLAAAAAIAAGACFVCACNRDGTTQQPPAITGTMTVEVIDTAQVTIQPTLDGAFDVSLAFESDYGLFDPSSPITAHGRLDAYPEADMVAYTAKLSAPPYAQGACGGAPLSLAMTLVRRGKNAHLGGGVAVYCGAGTYAGSPQRILRLQGDVPGGAPDGGAP